MELHALDGIVAVAQPHDQAIVGLRRHLQLGGSVARSTIRLW